MSKKIKCACWVGRAFCPSPATHVVGTRKGFPLPCCSSHAKAEGKKPGVTVLKF